MRAGRKILAVVLLLVVVACPNTRGAQLGSDGSPIPDGYGPPTAHPGYDSEDGAPTWAHNWGGGGVVMQVGIHATARSQVV